MPRRKRRSLTVFLRAKLSAMSGIRKVVSRAVPGVPTGLTVEQNTAGFVTISWTNIADSEGWKVYRGGVLLSPTTSNQYQDSTVAASQIYSYQVAATNGNGDSAPSSALAVTTPANTAPVWSLVNQTLTAGVAFSLNLSNGCADIDGHSITYTKVSGGFTGDQLAGSVYFGTPASSGTPTVTFRANDGYDTADTTITLTIGGQDTTAPTAPTAVSVSANGGTVTLTWTSSDDASGINHYKVYRNGSFLVSASASPLVQTDVSNGTYIYAVSGVDNSSNLNESTRTTANTVIVSVSPPAPDVPINFGATAFSSTRIDLAWTAGAGGGTPTGYELDRATNAAFTTGLTVLLTDPTSTVTTLTYSDTGLTAGTQYFYRVRAINTGIPSAGYATANATTQVGGFPTLFQDLSGRAFAGLAGALSQNDNWATTVYDYQPQYAPTIPTLPTYNSGNAAHALCTTRAQLITALGDTTKTAIFVQKGIDIHGSGDITIDGKSGTAVAPRFILYYDNAEPTKDLTIFKPWNLAVGSANRAQCERLWFTGNSSYYYIVGLNFGKVGFIQQNMGRHEGTSNNIFWYRCAAENGSGSSWLANSTGCFDITAYQCVSHSHDRGCLQSDNTWVGGPQADVHCFLITSGTNIRVISCEGWDHLGDFVQVGTGGAVAPIIEDNDSYVTSRHYCDSLGNPTVTGSFHMGEGPYDIKTVNVTTNTTAKVFGNRSWGYRRTSPARHEGNGNSPGALQYSNDTSVKRMVDWRWNIVDDCTLDARAISLFSANAATSGAARVEKHSVVRNIVNNCRCTGAVMSLGYHQNENYLNTINNCTGTKPAEYTRTSAAVDGHDMMGNFFQDVPNAVWGNTNNLGTNGMVGYNLYAGTYRVFNKTYAASGDKTFAGAGGKTTLAMGNFTYRRKKLTTPEAATITGIVPTATTLAQTTAFVPTSGEFKLGVRTNIGVDDLS